MSKIKILFIITDLYLGGAEMMLYKILSRIYRNKFAPEIVSLIDGGIFNDRFLALNISVHMIGVPQGILTPNSAVKQYKTLYTHLSRQ